MKNTPTLCELTSLAHNYSLNTAIERVENYLKENRVERLTKPSLKQNATSEEVYEYFIRLRTFEVNVDNNIKQLKEYDEYKSHMNKILKILIEEEARIDIVPEPYRARVWARAWNLGHSNGWYEVYIELCELVALFNVEYK